MSDHEMSRNRRLAVAAAVVTLSLVAVGCGSKSSSTNRTTTTGPRSTTATATTSMSTTTTTSVATDTAVWPFVTDSIRYSDPVQAATGFAVTYLGFANPVVGAFMEGDNRSGEVVIRPNSTGPETTVIVRKLAPDETWWVLGASTPMLQLQSPEWNASIASPVTLSGQSTAFEATVNVQIRQDGTLTPLANDVVMGGSMGRMGPFSKAVRFRVPTAERGAIILRTLSAKDGNIAEAAGLRIQFTDLRNVIKSALDTGYLSQLRPYLASSVDYAIAASGAYATISPDGAINNSRISKTTVDPGTSRSPPPPSRTSRVGTTSAISATTPTSVFPPARASCRCG